MVSHYVCPTPRQTKALCRHFTRPEAGQIMFWVRSMILFSCFRFCFQHNSQCTFLHFFCHFSFFFFFFFLTVHCISFLCSTTFFDHALCTFSTFYHIFDSALSSFSTFYHIFLQCAIYLFYILPHFFTAYCVPFLLSTTFFPVCLIVFKQAQR